MMDEIEAAAHEVARLVDPSRVRMARELKLWSQQDLAHAAKITPAAMSQIEKGLTRPSGATLAGIARATECPPGFFVRRFGDRPAGGFFRSLRSAPMRERRRSLARARLLHDLVEVMEEHLDLPDLNLPQVQVPDNDIVAVEEAAAQVRRYWNIEPGPIAHVVRLLERNGLVVVRARTLREDIDAFSVYYEDRPIVVLSADKGVTARSRFDAAHELAHQVLHRGRDPREPGLEDQAQQFAAAFLMPADDIREHLPSTANWPLLMELSVKWRVSMQALIRRSHTLGVMTDHQYDNARKAMSARGWLREEPGEEQLGPVELPVLVQSAIDHLAADGFGVERLATEASLPLGHVHDILEITRPARDRLNI